MAIARATRRPTNPPDIRLICALLVRRNLSNMHDVTCVHGKWTADVDAAASTDWTDEPRKRSIPAGRFEGEIGERPNVEPA